MEIETVLPSEMLSEQHRLIDVGVKGIVDGGGTAKALQASLELLRRHLYVEEAVLFPPLAESGLTMPVFVMKREHGQMWPVVQALRKACDADVSVQGLHDDCRNLLLLLQAHNTKEETIVYAASDRSVQGDPDAISALAHKLAHAQPPEDWACAMAPKPGSAATGGGPQSLASLLGVGPKP